MRTKNKYKAQKVNTLDFVALKNQFANKPLVFAIDVAKKEQFALLTDTQHEHAVLMHWDLLEDTSPLIQQLKAMGNQIDVVMESTGTYGDALKYQCRQAGFAVFQAHAKRVHDLREVYDGVPSLHDAKAARLIARLHKEGGTLPWNEPTAEARELAAQTKLYDVFDQQHRANLNRLEALLSRHWPEVLRIVDLDSVSLEQLIKTYGSPQNIRVHLDEARALIQRVSKDKLSKDKIDAIMAAAQTTLGERATAMESQCLQGLATEIERNRVEKMSLKKAVEKTISADETLGLMSGLVGKLTLAVLLGANLDPRNYDNARSYQKAFGLNLTEKSSGQLKGRLHLSKRGSSIARRYLYFAAMRLIIGGKSHIAKWYVQQTETKTCMKTLIALMRKIPLALWHVGQGEVFQAEKLLKLA